MGMVDAVKSFLTNYITFSGRASRSEFWFVMLAALIVGFVLGIVSAILKTSLLILLFELGLLIPSLALVSRRLHDINRSYWWALIGFIPLVGGIIMLVWYCTKGTTGDNRFGPDPLV